jgi:hypothetical protein
MIVFLEFCRGGNVGLKLGAVEVHGSLSEWLLKHLPFVEGAAAVTLGHVIVGCDQACLDQSRTHEQVHVKQYERWGPFFLPAYFTSSLVAKLRGKDPYLDNRFELEAYGTSD